MLSNINSKEKLLFSISITSIFAFFAGYFVGGLSVAVTISLVNITILSITKNIWFSDKSNYLLRMAAIGLASAVVAGTNGLLQPWIISITKYFAPNFQVPDFGTPTILYTFVLGLVFIVFYFTQDKSIIGKEPNTKPLHKFITEPGFEKRLIAIRGAISDEIQRIDRDTNWSASYFTPLDAEVEMQTKNGKKKLVTDLLSALKASEERLVLVLGEPGSGKSVALRKLCLDLLKIDKDVIPIYVNLKEWLPNRAWTDDNPPTQDEIKSFVLSKLKSGDIITRDFFNEYFDTLYENGYLYLVLDSFDELPAILGTKHDSKLIDTVSYCFQQFLKGARQVRAQGILASREFRKPTDSFDAKATFLIRPFSESKVLQTFQQRSGISEKKVKQLFRECSFLEGHIRNPFTTALLAQFITKNDNLPKNIAEVYKFFIYDTLNNSCKEQLEKYELKSQEVYNFMILMGKTLFEKGELEIEMKSLKDTINVDNFEEKIAVLKFARLIREGQGSKTMLSFSHRRFCEFFAVESLLLNDSVDKKLLSDIPTDSLWRDTLVLYCAVAPFENAKKIADFCWETLNDYNTLVDRNAIHTLRFMVDAFRGRKECLKDFIFEFEEFIFINGIKENDIFALRVSVEALTLLSDDKLDEGCVIAFEKDIIWITETALRSCRHLNNISDGLEQSVLWFLLSNAYETSMNSLVFPILPIGVSKNINKHIFSLSISESFKEVLNVIKWKNIRYKINFIVVNIVFIVTVFLYGWKLYSLYSGFVFVFFMAIYFIIAFFCTIITDLSLYLIIRKFKFSNIITSYKPVSFTIGVLVLILVCYLMFSLFANVDFIKLYFFILISSGVLIVYYLFKVLFFYIKKFPEIRKNYKIRNRKKVEARQFFENINYTQLNKRNYIYECYNNTYPYYHDKLLKHLEENIKNVEGEYPDNKFFVIGNEHFNMKFAQLEAKWCGIE